MKINAIGYAVGIFFIASLGAQAAMIANPIIFFGKPSMLSAGMHAASAALRSGCYLVKFTSNNYMETTPVVVQ